MDQIKLLIADADAAFCEASRTYLEAQGCVTVQGFARDGADTLDKLAHAQPDVLVLDLRMPNMDGFDVLERLQSSPEGQRPFVICTTGLPQDLFLLRAKRYPVAGCMLKPFHLFMLYQHVLESAGRYDLLVLEPTSMFQTRDAWVRSVLRMLSVPANFIGFSMLHETIKMAIDDPTLLRAITKSLYPKVSMMFNNTPEQVERNMRHAIRAAWARGGAAAFHRVLGHNSERQPTVSEFIALIVEKMRYEYTG
jgi:two-component system response regulator (stage 0 sporulation protein A)